ncbi:MAG: tRNA 2-thiocytidine biosynthesis TtcA family protein [Ignavibacteriales bacterium]
MKRILSCMRRAISDYNMIEDGDKIAVGLSGGKDSITLLLALNKLKSFFPQKFEIVAVCLSLGFDDYNTESLEKLCSDNGIEFVREDTNIGTIVFDIRKEPNPCSLCANMRRGALNNIAVKLGCNKVALGHHYDDVIDTFFLSLLYEGRINTFSPVTYLSRKKLNVIRPLIFIKEAEIKSFIKKNNITVVKNPCPIDCKTSRQLVKDLINNLCTQDPLIKTRVFGAIKRKFPEWDSPSN